MEEALHAFLVAGLPDVDQRQVNWDEQPHGGQRPYIVLSVVSMNEGLTQQGPDGLETYRVQIDGYAETSIGGRDLARDIKALLHGHHGGQFGLIQFSGMRRQRIDGDTTGDALYRASLDFMIFWRN